MFYSYAGTNMEFGRHLTNYNNNNTFHEKNFKIQIIKINLCNYEIDILFYCLKHEQMMELLSGTLNASIFLYVF